MPDPDPKAVNVSININVSADTIPNIREMLKEANVTLDRISSIVEKADKVGDLLKSIGIGKKSE